MSSASLKKTASPLKPEPKLFQDKQEPISNIAIKPIPLG
jgi:hypothetical protein